MAKTRNEALWAHTSEILALLFNIHRDPKKTKSKTADDFNPTLSKPAEPPKKYKMSEVKHLIENGTLFQGR
jgi:hypothetical protein